MKNRNPKLIALNGVVMFAACLALCAGCGGTVSLSGGFKTPSEDITGGITTTSNSVSANGGYQTGATNITGGITVTK